MCISPELFMLCFVFNTPSCDSMTARHEAVKTHFPTPPYLAGEYMAKSSPLRQKLRGALRGPSLWNSAPSRLMHHLIFVPLFGCAIHRGGDASDSPVWHPFLSTCPVTWSYGWGFSSPPPLPSIPPPHLHFKICYPNQRCCALLGLEHYTGVM